MVPGRVDVLRGWAEYRWYQVTRLVRRVPCLFGRHRVKWDGGRMHCVYCGKKRDAST